MGYPTYGPSSQNAANYQKVKIETATPEALILMLYDGALRFMAQAEAAFEENNIEKINNFLLRVQAIFTELQCSLDREKGGDIAANLERLYIFFNNQLVEANMKKDVNYLLAIKPMVQNLRDSWEVAMQKHQTTQNVVPPRPRLNLSA
jgi:flagellar protein FliS